MVRVMLDGKPSSAMKKELHTRICGNDFLLQNTGGKAIHRKSHPRLSLTFFDISISSLFLPIKLFKTKPLRADGELFLAHPLSPITRSPLADAVGVQRAGFPGSCLEQVG